MNGASNDVNGGGPQVAVAPRAGRLAHTYENGSSSTDDHPLKEEESADEDDVREELEREVDALMADKVYHDFVENVVNQKVIVDEEHDGDYEVEEEAVDGGGDANDDAGALSDSSSSTLTDFEDYEDAQEELEVKIPKQALMEAQQRFPPFWRVKHAMKAESMTDYKSDEDPDYKTEEEEEDQELEQEVKPAVVVGAATEAGAWRKGDDDQEAIEADVDASTEDDDESIGEDFIDEDAMKAEVVQLKDESCRDLQDDVDGLVEMVEYMTLPPSTEEAGTVVPAAAASGAAAIDEEDMDEEDGITTTEAAEAGQSILELDVDGYVSDEDPDFKPDPEILERTNDETGSTSSSEEEEDMEKME